MPRQRYLPTLPDPIRLPNAATAEERAELRAGGHDVPMPRTRRDCADGPRPCPWLRCRFTLLAEVTRTGTLVLPFGLDFDQAPASCALDVAERGPHKLDAVAAFLGGCVRERIRQLEVGALKKLQRAARLQRRFAGLREHAAP